VLAFANKYKSYRKRGESADYRKERRERVAIILLSATAFFTFVTAIIFYCQLNEMRRAYGPIKDSADAAVAGAKSFLTISLSIFLMLSLDQMAFRSRRPTPIGSLICACLIMGRCRLLSLAWLLKLRRGWTLQLEGI
jgi:hypothetical protein